MAHVSFENWGLIKILIGGLLCNRTLNGTEINNLHSILLTSGSTQ